MTTRDRTVTAADVSVIVVAFNSADTIAACVGSVPEKAEVIVVDQGCSDDSVAAGLAAHPRARVVYAGGNRGFGAGCNLGAANAGRPVLLFLNPDAVLAPGALEQLAATASGQNALVGPRLEGPNGENQTRARRRSQWYSDLAEVCLPHRLMPDLMRRDLQDDHPVYAVGGPVDYVQGSCMAISRHIFYAVGGFDERYFLYHEEEVLAERCATNNVPALVDPSAVVWHAGATSTEKVRYFAASQYYRSRPIYYRDRYGLVTGAMATLALWVTLMLMAIASPIRKKVGPRPHRDAKWHHAAAVGVKDGWALRVVVAPKGPFVGAPVDASLRDEGR